MKKLLLILTVVAISLFCFAGCGDEETQTTPPYGGGHTHTYDTSRWEYDEDTHWRASTCEHFTLRGSEATHTMSGGECQICGYSIEGMSVEEFTQNYSDSAKDFAMLCSGIAPQSALAAKISSEYVWFKTDEHNKLTDVTYIYTVNDDDNILVSSATSSGLNKIDLKEVAAGNANLQYQDDVLLVNSDNEFSYNSNQAEYQELAAKLFEVFVQNYDVSPYSAEPLLRATSVGKSTDGFGITVYDILDTGYAKYYVRVAADENATVSDLITALDTTENIKRYTAQVKDYGNLVYKNVKD